MADEEPHLDRHRAWEVTLDRLELDVIRAERALEAHDDGRRPLDEWYPPDDYGPIPAALRPRAEDLLARQAAVTRRIGERLGVTAARRAHVADLAWGAPGVRRGPVYVDLTA